ncbi:MAG TPA: PD-(D/E)XK nuclease family protein [Gemmatimonadales bacterium]|jgi:CRISPR/Cas system-associated exonuclease Cas4 (RecB family)
MAFEVRPFPDFSWSQSRRSMFRECPRKYYWQYYGSHNGWTDEADELARAAYRLKQVKSFHEFLGGVVHDLAADAIRGARGGERPLSAEELITAGRQLLNRAYAQSKRLKDWKRRPKSLTMFHEFYYGDGPPKSLIERIKEKLVTCLQNLLESQSYREALQAPYVEVKEVDRGPEFFTLRGHTVYAQPDLLYRAGDGVYRVVDWKTGQEDEDLHPLQLRTYALYVTSRADLKPGPIAGRLEYLFTGNAEAVELGEPAIREEEQEILDSIAMMRTYLADPDTNEARPLEAFPLREDTSHCRYCKFFELCQVEIEGAEASGPF